MFIIEFLAFLGQLERLVSDNIVPIRNDMIGNSIAMGEGLLLAIIDSVLNSWGQLIAGILS